MKIDLNLPQPLFLNWEINKLPLEYKGGAGGILSSVVPARIGQGDFKENRVRVIEGQR